MIYIDVNVFIKNLNIPKFKNLQNAHSKKWYKISKSNFSW